MTAWRSDLALAQAHAQAGRFGPMQALCQDLAHAHSDDVPALLDIGALLLSFGFLTSARNCFVQAQALAPAVVAPLPCLDTGRITFGCFNNTAKFNDGVFDVWARAGGIARGAARAYAGVGSDGRGRLYPPSRKYLGRPLLPYRS